MAPLRISLYKVSRLIPNKAYASETLMKSCPLGKFLTTSSKRFCLSYSSFLRLLAILEHRGEQFHESKVFARNSSPQI